MKFPERFYPEGYFPESYVTRMGLRPPKPYKYWDTPDGQDCHKKIWATTKFATGTALMVSVSDMLLLSHPKGYFEGFMRVAHFTVPAVSVGVTFSALACALTQVRNKDDGWNYIISGFLAGTVWGAARRSAAVGAKVGAFLSLATFLWKQGHEEEWVWFPAPRIYPIGTYDQYKWDWSLSPDPKDREK